MTTYINQLPHATQFRITELLLEEGITGEDLQNALESKLSDLEDTIDLNQLETDYIVQCYYKYTTTSRKTLKTYSKWTFVGWSLLPARNDQPYKRKGNYIIIGTDRYDVSTIKIGRGWDAKWAETPEEIESILKELGYEEEVQ